MKIGFSSCCFPNRSFFENLPFAKAQGFDFLEAYSPDVDAMLSSGKGDELASLISKTLPITIHHALPNPDDEEKLSRFRASVDAIHTWVLKYPTSCLVLSFDTWVNRERSLPNILYVLKLFSDTSLPIATEDFPLNPDDALIWKEALSYPNYCILSDLGHTNVRLSDTGEQKTWCLRNEGENLPLPSGDNSPEAFRNALSKKPLPIVELHIHNNFGQKDEHLPMSEGNADYPRIINVLKELGYDGLVNLELSPTIHGIFGEEADRLLLLDKDSFLLHWNQ